MLSNTKALIIAISGITSLGIACFALFAHASAAPTLSSTSSEALPALALHAYTNSNPHELSGSAISMVDGQALAYDKSPSYEHSTDTLGSETITDQISVYVVRDGDTLSTIANMFGVSENTIRWANDLNSRSVIRKDQQLIILPISGVKYIVKKGDTIKSIASKFNSEEGEILSFNNLEDTSSLRVGEEIIIPNGEITTSVSTAGTKSTSASSGSKSNTSNSGYFTRPLNGGKKTQGVHGHNGVDIASSLGTPILAAAGGKVIIAKSGGWNGGYGNYVVISHSNGMQTLYAHLNSVTTSVGQNVSQGSQIGTMGSTGQSTGVHLHFEVRGGTNPF